MTEELDPGQVLELRERAQDRLTTIPGVVSVGYGVKEVGGELTEITALRVYVTEKKPLEELAGDEVIPDEFEGVPTDVVTIPRGQRYGTPDTEHHGMLLGGITITNMKPNAQGKFSMGTLGCFATIDGVAGPENVVLLSNNHVLAANGGAAGDTTYQPKLIGAAVDLENQGPIAKNHNLGLDGPRKYTYPGPNEPEVEYHVDCASAKLNIDISSWCDCNCGVSYKNELREINIAGNSKLEGVARAVRFETVHKSGAVTGGTTGTITEVLGTVDLGTPGNPDLKHNVILINPTAPATVFADHGDSGSALVNGQNKLIGLVFGGVDPPNTPLLSFACHIAPVLDLLKVTPISTANPPVGPAGHARSARLVRVGAAPAESSRTTASSSRSGCAGPLRARPCIARSSSTAPRCVGLVNRHRPVTIAWHRGKGPAYFAHFAENARHPGHRIPFEVEAVTRRDLIERMEEALLAHGSEPLRAAIAQHREQVLVLIDDFDDLHELIGRFQEQPTHA